MKPQLAWQLTDRKTGKVVWCGLEKPYKNHVGYEGKKKVITWSPRRYHDHLGSPEYHSLSRTRLMPVMKK